MDKKCEICGIEVNLKAEGGKESKGIYWHEGCVKGSERNKEAIALKIEKKKREEWMVE